MDERFNTDGLGTRVDELLSFQKDLIEEKELLTKLLSKIGEQINALQVEQMHLINMMNTSIDNTAQSKSQSNVVKLEPSTDTMLDLSVATSMSFFKEETEDDDDDN